MTTDQVLKALMEHPGSMRAVVIESPIETLKAFPDVAVIKRSRLFVTAGTEYQNRREVREAIEAGERGEVQPLPWGHWVEDLYPYVIEHTPKSGFLAGQTVQYVRAYPPTEAQLQYFNLTPSVQFYADGVAITREQAITLCGSKAKADDERKSAIVLTVPNIISID